MLKIDFIELKKQNYIYKKRCIDIQVNGWHWLDINCTWFEGPAMQVPNRLGLKRLAKWRVIYPSTHCGRKHGKPIWKARTDLLPLQQPIMWTHLFRASTTMNPFSPWLYPLLLQKQHDARHLGPTWRFASSHWLQPDPLASHLRACRPYANQDKTGSNHAVKCTQN